MTLWLWTSAGVGSASLIRSWRCRRRCLGLVLFLFFLCLLELLLSGLSLRLQLFDLLLVVVVELVGGLLVVLLRLVRLHHGLLLFLLGFVVLLDVLLMGLFRHVLFLFGLVRLVGGAGGERLIFDGPKGAVFRVQLLLDVFLELVVLLGVLKQLLALFGLLLRLLLNLRRLIKLLSSLLHVLLSVVDLLFEHLTL